MGYGLRIAQRTREALLCLGILLTPQAAIADTLELGSDFAVLDQIVTGSFEPASLIVLQEVGLGNVRQYQAVGIPLEVDAVSAEQNPSAQAARRIIGAGVDLDSTSEDEFFHFTFFMASEDSGFAATETKRWNYKELLENSPSLEELSKQMAALRHRLKIKRVTSIDLEEKLEVLRRKASAIADVDGIIALKMEKASLANVESEKDVEIARLRELSELGRSLPEPENINALRTALADDLRAAAKITSMADRLNRRKQQAAEQHLKNKLRLIKNMESVDPESLAQKILELRKTRRDYEIRLGLSSKESENRDF